MFEAEKEKDLLILFTIAVDMAPSIQPKWNRASKKKKYTENFCYADKQNCKHTPDSK